MHDVGVDRIFCRHQSSEPGNPHWTGGKEDPQPGPAGATDLSGQSAPGCWCLERWGSGPWQWRGLAESPLKPQGQRLLGTAGAAGLGLRAGAGAVASASELPESSGRRGRPPCRGRGFPGWSEAGPKVADPDSSHSGPGGGRAGGQRGRPGGRPWPSRWPVFTSSSPPGLSSLQPLSPTSTSPRVQAALQEEREGKCQASSKDSVGALGPERKTRGGVRDRPEAGRSSAGRVWVDVMGWPPGLPRAPLGAAGPGVPGRTAEG